MRTTYGPIHGGAILVPSSATRSGDQTRTLSPTAKQVPRIAALYCAAARPLSVLPRLRSDACSLWRWDGRSYGSPEMRSSSPGPYDIKGSIPNIASHRLMPVALLLPELYLKHARDTWLSQSSWPVLTKHARSWASVRLNLSTRTIEPLHASVCLTMEGRGRHSSHAQGLGHLRHDSSDKIGPSVRQKALHRTKDADPFINYSTRNRLGFFVRNGDSPCEAGKRVNQDKDLDVASRRPWRNCLNVSSDLQESA